MSILDLIITPFYLVLIYSLAYYCRSFLTNRLTKVFFIPALSVKIFGAISLGLIYTFYYSGGDTFNYYKQSKVIFEAFQDSPAIGIKLLLANGEFDGSTFKYASRIFWYWSDTEYNVIKLAAFFGLMSFHTYTVIAVLFAVFCFSGVWMMYMTFLKLYPKLYKELAIAIFFIPSVFFWGSGLMKDTICLGALGWLFYGFYKALIEKKRLIGSFAIIFVSSYIVYSIKLYILLSFLAPALFWVFIENAHKIKTPFLRYLLMPFFIFLGIISAYYGSTQLMEGNQLYNIKTLGYRSKVTAEYIYQQSVKQQGSAYKLGELDGTLTGMVKLAPQAIIVSLFRPFLWEVRNPIMLLSAIEALIFLIFTLKVFFSNGIINSFKIIISKPLVTFCIIFSVIFAFAVGISTNNFGSLVRYKIPLLPFYVSSLFILSSFKRNRVKINAR